TDETFLFGFEERYGYLIASFDRDKDAVQAAVMACEMAYYWNKQGKTLLDVLDDLFQEYGCYLEDTVSITLKGKEGAEEIKHLMETVRSNPLTEIAGLKVLQMEDYLTGVRTYVNDGNKTDSIDLPRENVVKYLLEHHS